jgi:hypothetical protein
LTKPFSHAAHAPLKLKCTTCHGGAETSEVAGFPDLERCRTCHVGLAGRKIPSRRVYKVRDFVFFSHATHIAAGRNCNDCHGEVNRQPVLTVFRPTTMQACIDCHKLHKATVECNTCHELGQ